MVDNAMHGQRPSSTLTPSSMNCGRVLLDKVISDRQYVSSQTKKKDDDDNDDDDDNKMMLQKK